MSVYIVSAIEIHDPVVYAQWGELVRIAVANFDIEVISTDDDATVFEGTKPANHLGIVKFKSCEDYEAFVASEAYQRALPYRLASSTVRFMMAMDAI